MPALPPVTKTIRVNMGWSVEGASVGSRFFIQYTGGPPATPDLTTFAGLVSTEYGSNLAQYGWTPFVLTSVECTDLDTALGNVGVVAVSVAGTNADGGLALGSCTVVDFKIDRRYRGGKPRIYLPLGTVEYLSTYQKWTTGYVSDMDSSWGSFIAALLAASYTSFVPAQHVNVSYYHGYNESIPPWRGPGYKYPPMVRTGPITPDSIITHSTRQTIGSQRRRLTAP